MTLFAERRILTVSQLTALVRGVLEENFEHVWVEGEISNLATPSSGHLYFTLKDAGAQIRCVIFRAAARAIKFRLHDGLGLILRGRLTVYDQRGEYQILGEYLEPKGVGALQLAFLQLKEKLAKEGLFAEARKKPLPLLPQRIGIVTSPTGAALHDMLNVINRRFANVEILLYPVKVQGEGAAAEIAAAIADLNHYGQIDVMIVGRGGGSLEDLWAFNEEVVARAIAKSRIPVISAVGHEVDFTIADLVADLRAPTPSAAAELVVKSKDQLIAECEALRHRLHQGIRQRLAEFRGRLLLASRGLKDPGMLVGHLGQRLDDLQERLANAAQLRLERSGSRLDVLLERFRRQNPALQIEQWRELLLRLSDRTTIAIQRKMAGCHEACSVRCGQLQALSPLSTLARGYSIVQKLPAGTVITQSSALSQDDAVLLRFHQGSAVCRVIDVTGPSLAAEQTTTPST
jgi:exodeoxyribonuclease VII large subunit